MLKRSAEKEGSARLDKIEAYTWQLVWFFSMSPDQQDALILSEVVDGFVKEDSSNRGANYVFGLTVSLNNVRAANEDSEAALDNLRSRLSLLQGRFTKPRQWGIQAMNTTSEWAEIRELARAALELDGYRVSAPTKPLEIDEYPEHFKGIV